MAELTLGSLNLHMGRGATGHDAPFYDVVTACKEIDTDLLVLQEAWVPDDAEGDVVAVASALGYEVAGTFSVARAWPPLMRELNWLPRNIGSPLGRIGR